MGLNETMFEIIYVGRDVQRPQARRAPEYEGIASRYSDIVGSEGKNKSEGVRVFELGLCRLTRDKQYPHGLIEYARDIAKSNMNIGGAAWGQYEIRGGGSPPRRGASCSRWERLPPRTRSVTYWRRDEIRHCDQLLQAGHERHRAGFVRLEE